MNKLCQGCGSPLVFNVLSQKLFCKTCGSSYDVDRTPDKEAEEELLTAADFMNARIYRCDTCGAEISATKEEVATVCVYCGNPTIVFSRIAKSRRPEKIIPFSITKEKAISIIKKSIKECKYAPSDMKRINFDSIRGVYIPFYKHNLTQLESLVYEARSDEGSIYFRESFAAVFDKLLIDGSYRLDDSISHKLEPYDIKELELFSEDILMGFYADMADVTVMESREVAVKRAAGVLHRTKYLNRTYPMSDRKTSYKFNGKSTLMMLPAWFMTYKSGGKTYTFMVNGQTGKLVGGIPWNKAKLAAEIIAKTLLVAVPISVALGFFWTNRIALILSDFFIAIGIFWGVFPLVKLVMAIFRFSKAKASMSSSSNSGLISFVKNRQEGL